MTDITSWDREVLRLARELSEQNKKLNDMRGLSASLVKQRHEADTKQRRLFAQLSRRHLLRLRAAVGMETTTEAAEYMRGDGNEPDELAEQWRAAMADVERLDAEIGVAAEDRELVQIDVASAANALEYVVYSDMDTWDRGIE